MTISPLARICFLQKTYSGEVLSQSLQFSQINHTIETETRREVMMRIPHFIKRFLERLTITAGPKTFEPLSTRYNNPSIQALNRKKHPRPTKGRLWFSPQTYTSPARRPHGRVGLDLIIETIAGRRRRPVKHKIHPKSFLTPQKKLFKLIFPHKTHPHPLFAFFNPLCILYSNEQFCYCITLHTNSSLCSPCWRYTPSKIRCWTWERLRKRQFFRCKNTTTWLWEIIFQYNYWNCTSLCGDLRIQSLSLITTKLPAINS